MTVTRRRHATVLVGAALVVGLVWTTLVGRAAERAWITVLSTTDLHGNLLPIDYYTGQADARGLAKVATLVRQARAENPTGTLLLDSGDAIQGSPLEYLHNTRNNTPADPMMRAMSALGYDAMAVGNHEYNFGLRVLEKAKGEATFPWLSANTYLAGTNDNYHRPYLIKELGGVRVGVLGLTTAGIPFWENAQNYPGLEFREPLTEARKWVSVLRGTERADVVVVAMHMGLEEDLRTGVTSPGQVRFENEALAIARQVPGIDLILMGHTHRDVPSVTVNGVLLAQANLWGRHLARADLYLERGDDKVWHVTAKQSRTIPILPQTQVDAEVAAIAEPYDREARVWLSRPIGESAEELTALDGRVKDTAVIDLVQRVQLEYGQADVSMAAVFNRQARIPKGQVTVRDIAGLYVYDNTLVVLEVTGQQLVAALEHSAKFFKDYVPGRSPAELVDERIPDYNFDQAEGVTYDLDISRPVGQRVRNLRFRGQPVTPTQTFRLATNNYRVSGGGGYEMYKDAKVVMRSSQEIREMIIEWVEKGGRIPTVPTNNWHVVTGRADVSAASAPLLSHRVVASYPHDSDAFTQGLIFRDGMLYESTGLNGRSSLRRVSLETGEVLQKREVARRYFAEGLAEHGGELFQLTWESGLAFVYDPKSFALKRTLKYQGEGWGLTTDGTSLILSDGSDALRFFDPQTFQVTGRVTVQDDGRKVERLNELEFVHGFVLANVWLTDRIAIIDPGSGNVSGWLDLGGLHRPSSDSANAVLNGIAYDRQSDRLFVTGKLWPKLYEIQVLWEDGGRPLLSGYMGRPTNEQTVHRPSLW